MGRIVFYKDYPELFDHTFKEYLQGKGPCADKAEYWSIEHGSLMACAAMSGDERLPLILQMNEGRPFRFDYLLAEIDPEDEGKVKLGFYEDFKKAITEGAAVPTLGEQNALLKRVADNELGLSAIPKEAAMPLMDAILGPYETGTFHIEAKNSYYPPEKHRRLEGTLKYYTECLKKTCRDYLNGKHYEGCEKVGLPPQVADELFLILASFWEKQGPGKIRDELDVDPKYQARQARYESCENALDSTYDAMREGDVTPGVDVEELEQEYEKCKRDLDGSYYAKRQRDDEIRLALFKLSPGLIELRREQLEAFMKAALTTHEPSRKLQDKNMETYLRLAEERRNRPYG